jgi:hypothetical protein
MASIFCPSCGSKSEYKFAIPNFCFKCGSSYSQASSFRKNIPPVVSDELDIDENEDSEEFEEFSNSTRVPRILKLQVDIDSNTDVKVLKFEDIINNSVSSFKKPKNLDIGNL